MASETTTSTEAHGGQGGGTLPQLDTSTYPSQLLWLALTFGALYLVLSRVLLPRIASAIETRKSRIASDLSQAEQLNQQAQTASDAYDKALADARTRANAIAQENRAEVTSQLDAEQARVDQELTAKMVQAEAAVAATRAKAMGEVGSIASSLVADVVEQLSGTKPSDKAVQAAIKSING